MTKYAFKVTFHRGVPNAKDETTSVIIVAENFHRAIEAAEQFERHVLNADKPRRPQYEPEWAYWDILNIRASGLEVIASD